MSRLTPAFGETIEQRRGRNPITLAQLLLPTRPYRCRVEDGRGLSASGTTGVVAHACWSIHAPSRAWRCASPFGGPLVGSGALFPLVQHGSLWPGRLVSCRRSNARGWRPGPRAR